MCDGLIPGFIARRFDRLLAVGFGRLGKARRCNHGQQKQENKHEHSLARNPWGEAAGMSWKLEKLSGRGQLARIPDHQMNFALSCPMRPGRTLVAVPKVEPSSMFPSTPWNWVWLKMLKNSPRISNDFDSVTGIFFVSP